MPNLSGNPILTTDENRGALASLYFRDHFWRCSSKTTALHSTLTLRLRSKGTNILTKTREPLGAGPVDNAGLE